LCKKRSINSGINERWDAHLCHGEVRVVIGNYTNRGKERGKEKGRERKTEREITRRVAISLQRKGGTAEER